MLRSITRGFDLVFSTYWLVGTAIAFIALPVSLLCVVGWIIYAFVT